MTIKDLLLAVKVQDDDTVDGVYVDSLVEVVTTVKTYGKTIEVSLGRATLDHAAGTFRCVLNEEVKELRLPESYHMKIIIAPEQDRR